MTIKQRVGLEFKILDYFAQEYEWAVNARDRNLAEPWEIVHNTTQRMLGVCNFCQTLGIDYNTLEPVYEDYKERIEMIILG